MARYRIAPAFTLALSILGMAAVSPSFAQTGPSLQISDNAGHSLTVTPAGGAVCSAGCSTASGFPQITAGKIIWNGTIGAFTIAGATGTSNHSSPSLDMGTVNITTGATGGTLTITFSDTGFLGSGPVVMQTLNSLPTAPATATAVYTSYTDDNNLINGTGTTVGTITAPATFFVGNGPSVQPFSMTEVETITMSANAAFNNDDTLAASPTGPISVSCAVGSGQVGVVYNSAVQVTGGQAPFTFTILSGSLPNGLTLDASTGTIQGTPTVPGLFSFTVLVTDSTGNHNSSNCGINILASSGQTNPLTLTCASGSGTAGVPYSSQFVATGGTAPYTFAVTSGTLPKGLVLSKTGALTGIPTTAGTYSFSVTVTDSTAVKALTLCKACSITINTTTNAPLDSGDTATIGFWHNKNGQALINSLNGGPTATNLGNTLATYFPHMYGTSGANLAGKTNSYIANLFMTYFNTTGQKTNAQVLAGALAAYVSNAGLAGGNFAAQYGFDVNANGTGIKTYNVGTNGSALGLANHQSYTVFALLQVADAKFPWSNSVANALNSIFSGINQTGDIN